MNIMDIGRICVKTYGREAGRKCIIVERDDDDNYVIITGPKSLTGVRRRRCNIRHLEPTRKVIEIDEGIDDETLLDVLESEGLTEFMREHVRIRV